MDFASKGGCSFTNAQHLDFLDAGKSHVGKASARLKDLEAAGSKGLVLKINDAKGKPCNKGKALLVVRRKALR